ncbi:hypothetical protein HYS47_00375, partial [Candidatus Woesearchaeota archaeon]|nr:hypothetical protein [Candidatus Woesearchaeota archaeon]
MANSNRNATSSSPVNPSPASPSLSDQLLADKALLDRAMRDNRGLHAAMEVHLDDMRRAGTYVHPYSTEHAEVFRRAFEGRPGVDIAYQAVIVEPLFVGRDDGYWDAYENGRRFWRMKSDTCKGVM